METKNIYQKLSEFQSIVGKLRKDQTNPFFNSKYADINTVLDVIREPLKKVGLIFTQRTDVIDVLHSDGTVSEPVDLLRTELINVDTPTDKIKSTVRLVLAKEDMQGLGSAITYARRYALVSMLGLEQEDDDGNRSVPSKDIKDFDPATEKVTFGKHKGKLWIDLPQFYLDWLLENGQAEAKSKAKKVMDIKPKEDNTDIEDVIGEDKK